MEGVTNMQENIRKSLFVFLDSANYQRGLFEAKETYSARDEVKAFNDSILRLPDLATVTRNRARSRWSIAADRYYATGWLPS